MQDTLREGFRLLAANRLNEASECCRRLLGAKPDLVEAHFLVGLVALELKETWAAVSAFGSVTKLDPKHGAAWAHLAKLYASAGQPARADRALEQAVLHEDGNPIVADLIGTVQSLLGEHLESRRWFGKAVARSPEHVPFLLNLANNHVFMGELDEAERIVQRVLSLQPKNPNAHWILANLRRATDRTHVGELERLAREAAPHPAAAAFLWYALGKELEDLGEWDAAFAAFERGARARRQTVVYDEAAEVELFAALASVLTPEWLAARPVGCADPSPIFVVGQPRTGTTLVERIITSHSQVHSAGELRQFGICLRRLSDYREPRRESAALVRGAARIDPRRLGEAYIATTRKLAGDKPRFVDKLPPNYRYIPLILAALPNAKIVHLRRDPMDACFASYKQLFADAYPHSYDQLEMARHHARYYQLMELWRRRFPERFYEVAYEDVASDLETQARGLIAWLGLPWEDACLEFHRQAAAVTTASAVQVREPVHTRSIGRWRRYARQLEPMRHTLEALGVPVPNGAQPAAGVHDVHPSLPSGSASN
jgi:tetratricopeptide (TPR) repeat protein